MSAFGFLEDFFKELRTDEKIRGEGRNKTIIKQGEKISETRLGDIRRAGQRGNQLLFVNLK